MINWPLFLSADARIDFWTIVTAILCNSSCALLGCYFVLRKMSLLSDAISHSILAGLAFAFLLTGSLSFLPMLTGGLAAGLLTAFLTQTLKDWGDIPSDASMGIVYTTLFALGIILISRFDHVHLDTDCILFGQISLVSLNTVSLFGWDFPHAFLTLFPLSIVIVLFLSLCWKELLVISFDTSFASTAGFPVAVFHYLLMGLAAAFTVASLEAVGAILVVAMFIIPPATAHLLTERLFPMLIVSVIVACLSAVIGCLWARAISTNAAGMMAVVAGILFFLAICLAPKHGWVSKAYHRIRLAIRIAAEDIIAILYRLEEQSQLSPDLARSEKDYETRRKNGIWEFFAVPLLRRKDLLTTQPEGWKLTEKGLQLGRSLVRSHRLWETWLDEHFELNQDHLHDPAERFEHYIGPEMQERISRDLEQSRRDPHGSHIPPADPMATDSDQGSSPAESIPNSD